MSEIIACSKFQKTETAAKSLKKGRKREFKKRFRDNAVNDNARKPVPLDETDTKLCTVLWRAVVVQALYDISSGARSGQPDDLAAKAALWIFEKTKASNDNGQTDFEFVCELASLSPKKVRQIAKKLIERSGVGLNGLNTRSFRRDYMKREVKRNNNK